MTRNQINVYLASILTTIAETDEAPSGIIYSALMANGVTLNEYMQLQTILVSSELCTLSHDVLRLTDRGHELANEINKIKAA
tara:strand:+ start:372 stop:617 length:246 start_codon:yes stop_codon:yes gene_type:complete